MMKIFIAFEPAAAHPQKGDPVKVFWVQVGMDLKDKTTEAVFFRIERPGKSDDPGDPERSG